MKKITFPFLLLSLLIVSAPCFAETLKTEVPIEQSYGSQVGEKALNGFANLTTAILEIPKNMINTTNDSNIVLGTVGGLMKGIIHTLGRMGVGLADLITAPIPTTPIAQPAYIWDDFDLDTTYGGTFRLEE